MGSYDGEESYDGDESYPLEYVGLGKGGGTFTWGRPNAQPPTVATVTSASPATTTALIPVRAPAPTPVRAPPRTPVPVRMHCFILPIPRGKL
ncbi:hypothetical protein Stube_38650 [Streptomyces tubercidicus]|uniref:Uncharacterized protein n=1 Tax=Streptomyces tubercidicus TaxID=47759 RepID=A0A640UV19_9ACTN|nr:hypothetical protein Stube_38650 [Streptomyces tubercidicus]